MWPMRVKAWASLSKAPSLRNSSSITLTSLPQVATARKRPSGDRLALQGGRQSDGGGGGGATLEKIIQAIYLWNERGFRGG